MSHSSDDKKVTLVAQANTFRAPIQLISTASICQGTLESNVEQW